MMVMMKIANETRLAQRRRHRAGILGLTNPVDDPRSTRGPRTTRRKVWGPWSRLLVSYIRLPRSSLGIALVGSHSNVGPRLHQDEILRQQRDRPSSFKAVEPEQPEDSFCKTILPWAD